MSIERSDVILLAHATFGVLGVLSALWVFVEALNAREDNEARTRRVSLVVAACMCVAWILGGYWYLHFYPADKAMILKGPWPFAHSVFMETKEHLFFLTLILSLYLPVAAWGKLWANSNARKMVLCVSMLIALTGVAMEGSGAIVNHGAKIAYVRASLRGSP
ncbi:MAG TPA: hypothetical protein VNV41_01745 [Candidatus Acidoferrales bacterium]|jgi:hypothetical protein|nr:hypothetical protein [Candidatus Acidoferrales bacterium]